jgi:hypothetical protein
VYGRYADIESKDELRIDGKPFYEVMEAEIGAGLEVNIANSVNLLAKIGYNTASDIEWW